MSYRYFYLRDLAWKLLIDSNIKELPVDLEKVLKHLNLQAFAFDFNNKNRGALATLFDGTQAILYSTTCDEQQARFTIAHEVGHIILNHNNFKGNIEKEANSFAARLLMPLGILNELNVQSAEELAKICNVSIEAAGYRFERLEKLKERNKFRSSILENELINNFKYFIEKK